MLVFTSPEVQNFPFLIIHPIPSCIMHNALSSLPYHISSPLWWWQSDIPAIWIPLSHSICVVNDKSSHAALVLRAATASQRCVQLLCYSLSVVLSPPLSPPLHFAPSTGCICSEHAQCSSLIRCSGGVTDTEWRLIELWGVDADKSSQRQRWMTCARFEGLIEIRKSSIMQLQILRHLQRL